MGAPSPSLDLGARPALPLLPLLQRGGRGSQPASLPFPWCWESPEQHRVPSRLASIPLQPPRDTPWWGCPLLQPPSPLWWAPACSLLPLSPKSLALLGWYPWAGGQHPVPGGTQKLIAASLCSSSDNEKSSRAAASLLGNMWQYTKLHRDFKVVRTSLLWGPGVEPKGARARAFALENRATQMHPGTPLAQPLCLCLLKRWGHPHGIIPLVAGT